MAGRTLGYDQAGSGPVLVLVHGFPLDRTMWSEQLQGLSDLRRVVAVDLRGRGKSPGGDPVTTIDDHADDVAATVESLGVDRVDLAGLSMGGYVVFAFRRRHPQMVRSLILIDTKAADDPPEAKEGREKAAAAAREQGTIGLFEGLGPRLLAPSASDEMKARLRAIFESVPGEASAADSLAMRGRPDSTPDLAAVDIPTLVIHGAEDALMPAEGAEEMAGRISGARFVPVPNAGHMAPFENPRAVNAAIREFLESVKI